MKIGVIGDVETVIGFGLAGVGQSYPVATPEEAKEAFKEATDEDMELGILIITEEIADWLGNDLSYWRRQNMLFPIIVEIPDKTGPKARRDPIKRLIMRAFGVDITKTP